MRVGTIVGMPDDLGIVNTAEVVEDRGNLGIGGEQIVRLRFRVEGVDEDFETERPVSELTAPPTESIADQLRRRDRAERRKVQRARRAATA